MFCSAWFLMGSLAQLHLAWHAKRKSTIPRRLLLPEQLPFVTIQAPVYNERYVIQRLLESLGKLDYPSHLFEIQVLDDSTDDTSAIVDEAVAKLQLSGISVQVIRRNRRQGYKAGALQHALQLCRGELIVIFDADFVPSPAFLANTVGHFADPKVGGVQGRWLHQNLEQNALTKIQAFLLDSHFRIEQEGRNAAGYFMNFNGTAGIWRKQCIIESGGWNGNVLTEDLELSYRAQLKGWRLVYDNDVAVPAELPAEPEAFKVQQFRWAKGMAQTAARHLGKVFQSSAPFQKKMHALFHLLGSLAFVAVMGNILLSIPIIIGRHYSAEFRAVSDLLLVTGLSLPLVCIYYYMGTSKTISTKMFLQYLPVFLVIYMALSVQNSIAVLQGLKGDISPFIRTPKTKGLAVGQHRYSELKWSAINSVELLTLLYLAAGIFLCLVWGDFYLLLFVTMVFVGLAFLLRQQLSNILHKKNERTILADVRS
jgi:cellulose synthase/poly-beta-1,6-N-acetylglucosamine synthase-like glycosyltransferase